jgi:hypothetical protein
MLVLYPAYLREPMMRWMVRMRVSRLRRIGPRPFGLAADPGRPPLMLGDESSSAGVITEARAALTSSAVPLDRISLLYGDYFDLSAPLVEVTTHWDGTAWSIAGLPRRYPEGARELGEAERRDAALASGNLRVAFSGQRDPADGPFTHGSAEIVVGGKAFRVPTVSYRDYTATSFTAERLTVTVVSRHPLLALPRFDRVTDLEPFFEGYAHGLEEWSRRRRPARSRP